MAALTVELLPALSDNYIYLLHEADSGTTAVVDPAEPGPVIAALDRHGWSLDWILNTHHHMDHIGGNAALKERYGARIVGPRAEVSRIADMDRTVGGGDEVAVGGETARVFEDSGPYQRPHRLLVRVEQGPVLRRHPVRAGLRPAVRGHAGPDVGTA